jgi:hypothetical protein
MRINGKGDLDIILNVLSNEIKIYILPYPFKFLYFQSWVTEHSNKYIETKKVPLGTGVDMASRLSCRIPNYSNTLIYDFLIYCFVGQR